MLLSNVLNNRFNNLIDTFNEEDIISRRQTKNVLSPLLVATRKNKIANNF